ALRDTTVRAAVQAASGRTVAAVASARVTAWVDRTSRRFAWHRGTTVAGALLLLGTGGTGLTMLGVPTSPPQPPPPERIPPPDPRETIRREMLQLKGTWLNPGRLTTIRDGVPDPPEKTLVVWSIDRDVITETTDQEGLKPGIVKAYRYSVDPTRSPKTMDLTSLNTGESLHGLYRLEG